MREVVSAYFEREIVGEHTLTSPYWLSIAVRVPTSVGIVTRVVRAAPVTHVQAQPLLRLEELAWVPAPTEGWHLPL